MRKQFKVLASFGVVLAAMGLLLGSARTNGAPQSDVPNEIAQTDASDILYNVAETYRAMTTFQAEGMTVTEMNGPNIQNKMEIPMKLTFASPNRLRMESKTANMGILMIFDGKIMWMYMPQMNIFSKLLLPVAAKSGAEGAPDAALFNSPFGRYEHIAENVKEAKILRSEAVLFDGSNVDCYVVEIEHNQGGKGS